MNNYHYLLLSWFKQDQLTTLGLTTQQFDFLLAFIFIGMLYFAVKPLVDLLIQLNWNQLSAYLITLLLFSNFISIYRLVQLDYLPKTSLFSDNTTLLLVVFSLGLIISIAILFQRFIAHLRLVKKHSS